MPVVQWGQLARPGVAQGSQGKQGASKTQKLPKLLHSTGVQSTLASWDQFCYFELGGFSN